MPTPPFKTFLTAISYDTPDQVPPKLRATIRDLRDQGYDMAKLAEFFGMPEDWILLFCSEEPPENIQ